MPSRFWERGLVLAAIIAFSGCSDDGTAETRGAENAIPAEAATAPVESSSPPAGVDEPTLVVPSASFRGVTAETITIGVAAPDFAPLVAAGQPFNWGSAEIAYQSFFDQLNAAGGVHGRTVEGVFTEFDFLDNNSQDRACAELSEDTEVFMVMHGVLRDSNLCFTELNEMMIITETMLNAERIERSTTARWLTSGPRDDVTLEITAAVLAESGRLADRTVGIVTSAGNDDPVDALADALRSEGIEPVISVIETTPNDVTATVDAYRLVAERFATDGVDFVFTIGDVALVIETFSATGIQADYALSGGAVLSAIATGMADSTAADGAVAVSFLPDDELWAHPDFEAQCLTPFREANPELAAELEKLPSDVDQAAGEVAWVGPIRRACFDTIFFAAVAAAAGPDLTYDTFLAALDHIGPIHYPGWGDATYRPDKWDGLDTFYLQEFDATIGDNGGVRVVGNPIVIDR